MPSTVVSSMPRHLVQGSGERHPYAPQPRTPLAPHASQPRTPLGPRFSEQAIAFSAVDEDKTLKISLAEAAKVPDTIFSTTRGACGMDHVTAVRSRVEFCFYAASGADELLARREYQGSFMPCLIRSLADPCHSAVCSDPYLAD